MRFTMTVDMDNAAFGEDGQGRLSVAGERELARILGNVVGQLESGNAAGTCRDANGNTVGQWGIRDDS